MQENSTVEKIESVLRKINWAQQILDSAKTNSDDMQIADIISGVAFIIDSAADDAEVVYRSLQY